MKKVNELKEKLQQGKVYQRKGLARWSNAVDRHLKQLLDEGTLVKLSQGLYYYPKKSAFGYAPPDEKAMIRAFLNDDRFLITSPNVYNALGIGATQLYNQTVVYNHKRHGQLALGNRTFNFRKKSFFPLELSREFLLVDLVNNVARLAEDKDSLLAEVKKQLSSFEQMALADAVRKFGGVATKKFFAKHLGMIRSTMAIDYLHNRPDFADLIRIVGEERSIVPALVEKDYWIMHCLYGLQQLNLSFELKGGTSLSKGFGIINRFSEDIDIRIEPPKELNVKAGRNHSKRSHVDSRKRFYDWLAETININGVLDVIRDPAFDDRQYRSGGIRLHYATQTKMLTGIKEGILLEVGFDDVIPNMPTDISSWAYDYAIDKVNMVDNRAKGVACYHPGYTFVEKLQTISTKYRQQQEHGSFPINFMRHYYDVYCLLQVADVKTFIGTSDYQTHKQKRFRSADNPVIAENEAFLLNTSETRRLYEKAYEETAALYYHDQPTFGSILHAITDVVNTL